MDTVTRYLEALARLNEEGVYPTARRLVQVVEPYIFIPRTDRNRYNARYQLLMRCMARGYLYTRQEQDGMPHSLVLTVKGRNRMQAGRKAVA